MIKYAFLAGAALALISTQASAGILGGSQAKPSSGRNEQTAGQAQIPQCSHKIGTLAIVPPDKEWWHEYNLGSPEAIIKVIVAQSGCFTMVNRGSAMQSRAMERALAEQGELQKGSRMGPGQVKSADYFLQPDIVTANQNSGGSSIGAAAGGILGHFGGWGSTVGAVAGGINVKKGEANVTLSLVNARTTEEEALTEGYFRKRDLSFAVGGGGGWWGGFAAAGGGGYENTEIGQIIVLAYLDAYPKLVAQLGGIPPLPPAAPPPR
jgi:curli biogenesis system outer membrane secretion channel CsgG